MRKLLFLIIIAFMVAGCGEKNVKTVEQKENDEYLLKFDSSVVVYRYGTAHELTRGYSGPATLANLPLCEGERASITYETGVKPASMYVSDGILRVFIDDDNEKRTMKMNAEGLEAVYIEDIRTGAVFFMDNFYEVHEFNK